jgi:hypothetical protein
MDTHQQTPRGSGDRAGAAGRHHLRRHWLFWALHSLYWLVVTFLSLGMSYALTPDLSSEWLSVALRMVSGAVLTGAVYWLFQQPWLRDRSRLVRWPLMLVCAVGLTVGSLPLMQGVGVEIAMNWTGDSALAQIVPRVAAGIFWCTVCFGFELFDGLYAAELRLAQAEVDAARKDAIAYEHQVHRLHAQMNPHFLFNALNAVVAFRHSPDDVARVTQDLADFLRSALRDSRLLEPLAREIQTLEMYLAVQQTRFGEKLDCRIVCDRKARGVMVPPMIVQPLLENAIAYGMQTSETSLRVDISARVDEGTLEIAVVNSGTWIEPDPTRSPGTGLKTLRKRLALLIGPSASVTVDPAVPLAWASNGTCVRVTIRMPVANNTESSPFANSLLQESMT